MMDYYHSFYFLFNMSAALRFLANNKTLQVKSALAVDSGWKTFFSANMLITMMLLSHRELKLPEICSLFNLQSGWIDYFPEP